jgi:hypothetical protein
MQRENAMVSVNLPGGGYAPPPIHAIPVVRSTHTHTLPYDIADPVHKWIEPEIQQAGYAVPWAYYREPVVHLDCGDMSAGITIRIETRWAVKLYLECLATPAYAMGDDLQFSRLTAIPDPKRYADWVEVYVGLKQLALEWLAYARVYLWKSAQLTDPDDRLIMGKIAYLQLLQRTETGYRDMAITPDIIARWCGWFTWVIPQKGAEDVARVRPHLRSLVERGYLKRVGQGEYHMVEQVSERDWERREAFSRWPQE